MKRLTSRALRVTGLIFLLALAWVIVTAIYDDTLLANTYLPARAAIVPGDGADGTHRYQYFIGDRLCQGTAHLDYDPVSTREGVQG